MQVANARAEGAEKTGSKSVTKSSANLDNTHARERLGLNSKTYQSAHLELAQQVPLLAEIFFSCKSEKVGHTRREARAEVARH